MTRTTLAGLVMLLGLIGATPAAPATLHSYALVQDDATLLIRGKIVHLYGVYLPDTGRACRRVLRPVRCASRAALALDFIIQGFVECDERDHYDDGSLSAVCWTDRTFHSEGTDLGAYLIHRGLAVAGPDAPFDYVVLERIARRRGLGLWGGFVDVID